MQSHLLTGVGVSGALATQPPRRGRHECFVAFATDAYIACYSMLMAKGARSRVEEEGLCGRLVLAAMARECGVASPAWADMSLPGVTQVKDFTALAEAWASASDTELVLTARQHLPDSLHQLLFGNGAPVAAPAS
ncbi:hypothetical protein EON66_08425, partial [archaeon]